MGHNRGHLTHRRHLVTLNQQGFVVHALSHIIDQNNHARLKLIFKRVNSDIKMVLTALAVFDGQGFVIVLSLLNLGRANSNGGVGFP